MSKQNLEHYSKPDFRYPDKIRALSDSTIQSTHLKIINHSRKSTIKPDQNLIFS